MHICNGFVINKMRWPLDREGAREGKGGCAGREEGEVGLTGSLMSL